MTSRVRYLVRELRQKVEALEMEDRRIQQDYQLVAENAASGAMGPGVVSTGPQDVPQSVINVKSCSISSGHQRQRSVQLQQRDARETASTSSSLVMPSPQFHNGIRYNQSLQTGSSCTLSSKVTISDTAWVAEEPMRHQQAEGTTRSEATLIMSPSSLIPFEYEESDSKNLVLRSDSAEVRLEKEENMNFITDFSADHQKYQKSPRKQMCRQQLIQYFNSCGMCLDELNRALGTIEYRNKRVKDSLNADQHQSVNCPSSCDCIVSYNLNSDGFLMFVKK